MRKLALSSVAAALLACSHESAPGFGSERGVELAPEQRTPLPANAKEEFAANDYQPGRWRLARPDALSYVLVALSHILIRHEGVEGGIVSFQLSDWTPSPPPPTRTREQARALAEEISQRLQKSPNEFAVVARQASEDIASRALGGTLGTRTAAEFLRTPDVLDALAAMRPGEVSRVVETPYGFHVFQRRQAPEEQIVSGARILIAYDQAPWLGAFLARRPLPGRSREEAMSLAQTIYERAKRGESFTELAREYSDHREALRGGDFGAWSTREPAPFSPEIEALASLHIEEIHPPVDTPLGMAILQRTAERPRQSFAMATVQQSFDPLAPDEDPTSRPSVLKNVQALGQEIDRDPAKFAALQGQYCCSTDEHWIEGRGEAEAEAMLARLRPGEIASEPVALGAAFGIIKRLGPRPMRGPEFSYELPAPEKPDLRYLASNGRLKVLLRGFTTECAAALGLEPTLASQFATLLEGMMNAKEAETTERDAAFARHQNELLALLGGARFQRYLELVNAHVERELLRR